LPFSISICTTSPFFFSSYLPPLYLHSFPTRRSSDLLTILLLFLSRPPSCAPRRPSTCPRCPIMSHNVPPWRCCYRILAWDIAGLDRKSTRLNSSHLVISYAVFCLKKKKNNNMIFFFI